MSEVAIIAMLFGAAVIVLLADIFLPSHGILSVVGLGFLMAAVVRVFQVGGRNAGMVSLLAVMVFLPLFALAAIKVWPKTPIGRRIAPPNRVATSADVGVPVEDLMRYVGRQGVAVTPLRPVGICDFDGRRLSCITKLHVLDPGVQVLVTGLSGANLVVVPSTESLA